MPEVTIDKHSNLPVGEKEIRFARKSFNVSTESQSSLTKHLNDTLFEFCVAAVNASHPFRTFIWCQEIAHAALVSPLLIRTLRSPSDDNMDVPIAFPRRGGTAFPICLTI